MTDPRLPRPQSEYPAPAVTSQRPQTARSRAQQQAAAVSASTTPGAATQAPVRPGTEGGYTRQYWAGQNHAPGSVWMGGDRTANDHEHSNRSEAATGNATYSNEAWLTPDQAKTYITQMSPEEYGRLIQAASMYYGKAPTPTQAVSFWEASVDQSVKIRDTTGRKVSPFDVMNNLSTAVQTARGGSAGSSGSSSSTSTSRDTSTDVSNVDTTNTSTDLVSRTDAKALAEGAFKAALGRAPTDDEVKSMQKFLNRKEKKNPSKSRQVGQTTRTGETTTTQSSASSQASDGGNSVSNSTNTSDTQSTSSTTGGTNTTTSGGVNEQQVADDFAQKKNPAEYDAYQRATTYLNAFNRAIMSPV